MFITVRRRNTSLNSTTRFEGLSEEERETHLRESRAAFVEEYNTLTDPTLQRLLALCNPLLNIDVNIERKYVELDIVRVFEANKVCILYIWSDQNILQTCKLNFESTR